MLKLRDVANVDEEIRYEQLLAEGKEEHPPVCLECGFLFEFTKKIILVRSKNRK